MSQRGGSVVTYVKYGEKVYSPIIDKGEADIILAFEMLEAYRALPYLAKGGKMIVNTQKMNPMPVITGAMQYPEKIDEKLSASCDTTFVDALSLAKHLGLIVDESGDLIVTNSHTNISGIFAGGDCVQGIKQIVKAAAAPTVK